MSSPSNRVCIEKGSGRLLVVPVQEHDGKGGKAERGLSDCPTNRARTVDEFGGRCSRAGSRCGLFFRFGFRFGHRVVCYVEARLDRDSEGSGRGHRLGVGSRRFGARAVGVDRRRVGRTDWSASVDGNAITRTLV
jgi:hypothetical protein